MSNIVQSIQVSILAMGVIFVVLGVLIIIIRVMVNLIPYKEAPAPAPKASAQRAAPASDTTEEEHLAAIHAALAHHLGKAPGQIHIQSVTSL